MFTSVILHAGIIPFVASAVVALVMRRANIGPQFIWAFAFTIGFLVGQLAIRSEPGIALALQRFVHPHEAVDWLPLILLLALGVTILRIVSLTVHEDAGVNFARSSIALAAALVIAAPVRLLSGNVPQQWNIFEKLFCLAIVATIFATLWRLQSNKADERQYALRVPLAMLVACVAAVILAKSGTIMNGLSCGAVAAAIAGTAVAFVIQPIVLGRNDAKGTNRLRRFAFPGTPGLAGVLTFSLGSLILLGRFFAELRMLQAGLLFLALAATAVPLPAAIERGPAWRRLAARFVICALPLLIAIVNAIA